MVFVEHTHEYPVDRRHKYPEQWWLCTHYQSAGFRYLSFEWYFDDPVEIQRLRQDILEHGRKPIDDLANGILPDRVDIAGTSLGGTFSILFEL